MTRPLRKVSTVTEVVRAWPFGWWVKVWIEPKVGTPIIELWFPTKRIAERHAYA